MSATEISPSQSIEASLLNRHPSVSPQTSLIDPDTNTYASLPPTQQVPEDGVSDSMDHQSNLPESAVEQPEQNDTDTDFQNHDRMAMEVDLAPRATSTATDHQSPPAQSQPAPDSISQETPPTTTENQPVQPTEPQVLVAVQAAEASSPSENTATTNGAGRPAEGDAREDSAATHSEDDDNDDDEDREDRDDDSSSDEDDYWGGNRNFVANLKEDTSIPSEDELKDLESRTEHSALEQDYFKNRVFTSLDDPEYVPIAEGEITWTLEGFHGTKDAPNKQRVMRSPSVLIGGYHWSIKVYPHGNDGTDFVSVYLECTGPEDSPEPTVVNSDDASMQGVGIETTATEEDTEAKDSTEPISDVSKTSIDGSWEIAAQVGCVMYNPDEPRTYAFEHSNYQFHSNGPDCGWVRFYGPWGNIHQRRHLQRQPMLRNDKLTFRAYVRAVQDPTRALWFRAHEDGFWDSVTKTGLRGMSSGDSAGASVMAALAPWLHLQPFRKLILETDTPNMATDPRKPVRPLFQALQDALYRKYAPENHSPGSSETLSNVRRTLPLYGLEVRQSTDVIEIWETLRHALNAEAWISQPDSENPDVLSFIKTVRQNVRPHLPGEPDEASAEPRSIQEIIDQASEDNQHSYREWSGYHSSGQAVPPVLQIEMCRQRYDAEARKWKRLTHQIKMEEKIFVGKTQKTEYRHIGMVISKGELGSGRVYPIVRSAGVDSQWARYKSHTVTYLTRRQAVDSHEGKGTSREGTESVAHIAIYVRADVVDEVLPPPEFKPTSKVMFPLDRPFSPVDEAETIKIVAHPASAFKGYEGLSFLDAWNTVSGTSLEFDLPATSTLLDVQKKLLDLTKSAEREDQFRLWCVLANAAPIPHPKDLYFQDILHWTPVRELPRFFGGIRLWYSVIPMDLIKTEGVFRTIRTELPRLVPPPAAPPVLLSSDSPVTPSIPPPSVPMLNPPTNWSPPPPPPPLVAESPVLEPPPAPNNVNEPPALEDPPRVQSNESVPQAESDTIQAPSEDVVMGGTQELPASPLPTGAQDRQVQDDAEIPPQEVHGESMDAIPTPPPPDSTHAIPPPPGSTHAIPPPPPPDSFVVPEPPPECPAPRYKEEKLRDWQCPEEVLLLVKVFDPTLQMTVGIGSGFYTRDKSIKEIVDEFELPFTKFKLWRELNQCAQDNVSIDDDMLSAQLNHGSILVVAKNDVSENDREILRSQGKVLDYGEWYSRQFNSNHFSQKANFESGCYYGKKYAHAPLLNGKYSGESIVINTNGDAYKGSCLDGEYSGQGVMYYANGNTYTGEWANGSPEGQGTMVYNQTGNKYVGGWRAGRKHGKGVMTFEVADEEMQLCKICYENEMDALFYRCGHVTACESCARQVNDCPVCRRPVDAVVRIWRTI